MALYGGQASFNTLLEMNTVDIVENIFILLDRVSLENCSRVCKAWRDVISSELFMRRKASLSKNIWMHSENFNHQVFAYIDHAYSPITWVARGEEAVYFNNSKFGKCTYFNSDGERKTCEFGDSETLDGSWTAGIGELHILEKTILIVKESQLHFIDKQSSVSSTLNVPRPRRNTPYEPFTYFNAATGVSVVTLPVMPGNCIWVGHISIHHRQDSEWSADFDSANFITDETGRSYFAKVTIGDLTFASLTFKQDSCQPDFREDGTRVILRSPENGMPQSMSIISLDRENSRLLWSTEISMMFEFVHVTSQFVFKLNMREIKVLNIEDGTTVKTIVLNNSDWFWWTTLKSTKSFLLAFLPSPPPHFELNNDDLDQQLPEEHNPEENALDPDLVMVNLSTLKVRKQWIRESPEEALSLRAPNSEDDPGSFGFVEGKAVGVVPKCYREGGVCKMKICHLDLEASNVFSGQRVMNSRIPFGNYMGNPLQVGALSADERPDTYALDQTVALPEGYRFKLVELTEDRQGDEQKQKKWTANFREICRGVYVIEYHVGITKAMLNGLEEKADHLHMYCLEVVSWKSEELPVGLRGLLNERFHPI